MSNGRKPSEWVWDKLSRAEKNIDWVKGFFWFGLITIGIILVTFITSLILKLAGGVEILYIPQDQLTKHHYLLSATSQVLAAIFALVFSITLIVTQFVTKYTHRTIGIVFPKRVFFYILGFALAVIFPLWWLVVPFKIGSFISVVVASFFVFSIPGFFIFLTRKMRTDGVIKHLKTEAIKAVNLNDEENAKAMINALDSIAMGAYTDLNFEVFELAEEALADLLIKVGEILNQLKEDSDERKHFSKIHKSISSKLRDTCWDTIDNSRAPIITVFQVERIGISAVETKDWHTETTARNIIVAVAKRCIRDTRMRLSFQCFSSLYRMMDKHPPNAPLEDTVRGAKTMQEHYILDMLDIYDIHLKQGWQDWLKWLLRSIVEFIPRFEPSERVSREMLKNIWLTDARFDEPNTKWLYRLLEKNGMIENFLNEELHNSAVEKGRKLGIPEDKLNARWGAFQKHKDWRNGKFGYEVGPPEE